MRSLLLLTICRVMMLSMAVIVATRQSAMGAEKAPLQQDADIDQVLNSVLKQLTDQKFGVRVEGQKRLNRIAEATPAVLVNVAEQSEFEIQARIVRALETVFLSHSGDVADNAEKVLMALSHSDLAVADDANLILIANSRLREARARKSLENLGCVFAYAIPIESRAGSTAPRVGVGFGEFAVLQTILLSEKWSGTTAELWHLRRLTHHQGLMIYTSKNNGITLDDLLPLQVELPGATITERGGALGVRPSTFTTSMIIEEIVADGAADKAGLRINDEILMLNEDRVRDFSNLVELLLAYAPGETIQILIRRNGEEMLVPVKLSSWRDITLGVPPVDRPVSDFVGPLGVARPIAPALPEKLRILPRPRFQLQ
ncbi:PDZ domain-containing protein [Planctomicrobium sp. SH527]|uniref:PDZ domain-containing protein n=1 Tax=Planctomicrobium sp. SH527 TaxID=3448123 RepID=UPI003F5C1DC5